MKTYIYGLGLGAALSVLIFLSNVAFPNNGPDWAPGELMLAVLIGAVIVAAAFYGSRGNSKRALKIGAVTSLIGFAMAILTFVIVDNVFLNTVSQQADKISNFQHSSYSSMRTMINIGLLRGILVGTPASILFGLFCGQIATKITPWLRRTPV